MKNIITAIGNPDINLELKKEEINVIGNDIQYQDGIFEILQKENKIEYLILNETLPGENEIEKLIENILKINKKIKIILIIKNKKINNNIKNKIEKIYKVNNKLNKELIIFFKNKKINNIEKKEIKNYLKIIKNKIKKNKKLLNNNTKIISIVGPSGVGKSITTALLSKYLKYKKNKILILDFDFFNNSLHTIFGVNKYEEKIKEKLNNNYLKKININNLIIKLNKKIDLISGINLIFNNENKIEKYKLIEILNKLKNKYDLIIVDNSSECFYEYTKIILENSDLLMLLVEGNISEIKKANSLLRIYTEEWKINKNKIKIIINKYNIFSINKFLIKNIFREYKILGKLKINNKYNLFINKNLKNCFFDKKIKNEYLKLCKKIK